HAAAGGVSAILSTARGVLDSVPGVDVDYLEVRGVDLGPAPERGDGRLLVAARIGTTRLIDNVGVAVGTGFLEAGVEPAERLDAAGVEPAQANEFTKAEG
ncbi:MAG: pantoate--beta-alanine ligase, partial [Rhodococcus fascians]